jgi:hypothetical protein
MAPEAKASAPAHFVITGRVKGAPKISQDGSAVVVKNKLDDGATVQENFPKRRAKGKQTPVKQFIPAEEVLRTIEEATATVAEAVRAEGERKLKGQNAFANQMTDEQQRKLDILEHNYRQTIRTGGALLNKVQREADKQTKRAVKVAVAARAQTSKAKEQARQALSFAESIAQHVNA